jgi:hypothetical protein
MREANYAHVFLTAKNPLGLVRVANNNANFSSSRDIEERFARITEALRGAALAPLATGALRTRLNVRLRRAQRETTAVVLGSPLKRCNFKQSRRQP